MSGHGSCVRGRRHPLAKLAGAIDAGPHVVVVWSRQPASAHAVLLTSRPAREHIVSHRPEQVELTFYENVEISFGSIKVFNEKGDRVDIGAPHHSQLRTTRSRRACRISTTARTW